MIIFGTRGVTYSKDSGDFHCPGCGPGPYKHRRVRRFFTLYFIPVIPLDLLGEYVECQGCDGTYDLRVLDYDPGKQIQAFEAEYQLAIKRAMVLMMLADDVVEEEEIACVQRGYGELAGVALSRGDVEREIGRARSDATDLTTYLQGIVGRLNDRGKEQVVRAAYLVAASDGDFADEERELLEEIADALEMSAAHLAGVLHVLSG